MNQFTNAPLTQWPSPAGHPLRHARTMPGMEPISGYARDGILSSLRAAVTPRAALLVLGVLLLQWAFITSYVGALHRAEPHRIPLAVVAPEEMAGQLVHALDGLPGNPVRVEHTATDEADGLRRVQHRDVDGALIVDGGGTQDTLLVATGGGTSTAEALAQVLQSVAAGQNRTLEIRDVAPAAAGDARGLSSFFLVVGWVVGGYLCGAVLAISHGSRAATVPRALFRLGALAVYSLLGGLGGAVIVGPVLDALPGRVISLALLGALVVFATGALTLALQALFGIVGIGLTLLVVVILGNPSAGGAIGTALLPAFWRGISSVMIPGAGTWGARSVAYFDGHALTHPLVVLGIWAVAGVVVTLLASLFGGRRRWRDEMPYRTVSDGGFLGIKPWTQ